MADFILTQTDEQVQSILDDAQDAQGAGAQTTLTTDYIMLKDTSGRYHKILKDSFTEACRNVLAGLLVNNNKGTSVSQIPVVASGDFGSVTPANLASVLGAFGNRQGISNNSDLNNFVNTGLYTCANTGYTIANNPYSSSFIQLIVIGIPMTGTVNSVVQICYDSRGRGSHGTYIRTAWTDTDNGWSPWYRLDCYNTSTAAELASLLGVNVEKTEAQVQAVSTTSLEALRSMGNIHVMFSSSGTITPGYYSDLPQRVFGVFSQEMIGLNCIQEYYVPDNAIIYRRFWNNGSKTMLPWKKIVLVNV